MHLSQSSPQRLLVDPSLAMAIGLKEAMILHQMHYWLNPDRNSNMKIGRRWVYNTYEQWRRQFPFWSERTIQRSILNLEKAKILDTYLSGGYRKVKYYSINYDQLRSLEIHSLEDSLEASRSKLTPHSGTHKEENWHTQPTQAGIVEHERLAPSNNTENTTEITQHHQSDDNDKIGKEMLDIWNTQIHQRLHPGKSLFLTPERKTSLEQVLHDVFAGKVVRWQSFCYSIANSSFLMGKASDTFKITLEWALKQKNIYKILEGAYDSIESSAEKTHLDQPWESYFSELEKEYASAKDGDAWFAMCKVLAKKVGQLTFNCWLKLLKPLKINESGIHLLVPNLFIKNYILQEFEVVLKEAANQIFPEGPEIHIVDGQSMNILPKQSTLH